MENRFIFHQQGWTSLEDLNDGQPVLYSHLGMQGVRDPFLLRDPKQKNFI